MIKDVLEMNKKIREIESDIFIIFLTALRVVVNLKKNLNNVTM